jgi:hypothetical protein
MILKWVMIILLINLIWFLPLLEQWNLHDIINDKVFPKVKINKKIPILIKYRYFLLLNFVLYRSNNFVD